ILNARVYVNNHLVPDPPQSQMEYRVTAREQLNLDSLQDNFGVNPADVNNIDGHSYAYTFYLTPGLVDKLRKMPDVSSVVPAIADTSMIDPNLKYQFPRYALKNRWTVDNYGPIWIPKKGAEMDLN